MKTVLHVKVDQQVKEKAKELAGEFGLTMSALINTLLKQIVHDRSLNLSRKYIMTPELEAELEKVEEDIKNDRNFSSVITNKEELHNVLYEV